MHPFASRFPGSNGSISPVQTVKMRLLHAVPCLRSNVARMLLNCLAPASNEGLNVRRLSRRAGGDFRSPVAAARNCLRLVDGFRHRHENDVLVHPRLYRNFRRAIDEKQVVHQVSYCLHFRNRLSRSCIVQSNTRRTCIKFLSNRDMRLQKSLDAVQLHCSCRVDLKMAGAEISSICHHASHFSCTAQNRTAGSATCHLHQVTVRCG